MRQAATTLTTEAACLKRCNPHAADMQLRPVRWTEPILPQGHNMRACPSVGGLPRALSGLPSRHDLGLACMHM